MGSFSEFIIQLKHGWGKPREDAKDILNRIQECYDKKQWDDVIELCSMLNWQQEEFDADLTFILCESIFQSPSHYDGWEVANACADYYPKFKERFYDLCGRSADYRAQSSNEFSDKIDLFANSLDWFKVAKMDSKVIAGKKKIQETYLKWADSVKGDREKCIEIYNKAISDDISKSLSDDSEEFKLNCKKSIFDLMMEPVNTLIFDSDTEVGVGTLNGKAHELYNDALALLNEIDGDLWIAAGKKPDLKKQEVNDKIFELMMLRVNDMVKQANIKLQAYHRMYECFNLYDDALNLLDNLDCSSKEHRSRLKTRKKEISNKILESKKIIKPVEKEMAKEFNKSNFPSTSGYCNKIREEYPTLKDVMSASFAELKRVYGMGGRSESDLKSFIIDKGEELNKMLRKN